MVMVPRVQENSVQQTALSGARVNTQQPLSAFGGGDALDRTDNVARGLNKDAMNFALKAAEDADDVRGLAADLDMSKVQTDLQIEIKKMQGKNALDAIAFLDKEWKARTDKIYEGLSTDRQRYAFNKKRTVRTADLYNFTREHSFVEGKKYDAELIESYVKNAQNVASINFSDTAPGGKVEQSIFLQEQELRRFADRHGVPKELIDAKITSAISVTHSSVINQMLANHMDQVADEYYKNNKDAILPDEKIKLEKAIEQAVLFGEGQRKADEIFSNYSKDRNEAFKQIKDNIKDPELRKQTEDNLERMFIRQSLAKRADNQENYHLASQLVESNQVVPKNISSNLTAEQNAALERRLKQVNAGIQPNTDWATYYNLKTMASSQKNDFIGENLLEYRHVLADQEFKDLVNLQRQLSKNDPIAQSSLNGYRTSTQVINDTLASAGINVKSKKLEDQKRVAQFRREVDENVQILQDQTGKKAKSEDIQRIADNLLITAIAKRPGIMGIFDKEKKAFEIEYKDVPVSESSLIQKELKKRGIVPTEKKIVDLYIRSLSFKKGRDGY